MKTILLLTVLLGIVCSLTASEYSYTITIPAWSSAELLFASNNDEGEEPVKQKRIVIKQNTSDYVDMGEIDEIVQEALKNADNAVSLSNSARVKIDINKSDNENPYMGLITDDITLSEAESMGYSKFYGVLIKRVVPDSPARYQKLLQDDIIMEIDGQRVSNKRNFVTLVNSYSIGETVTLKIFRNRQEMTMDFVFGSRLDSTIGTAGDKSVKKSKISLGSFGGGWIPMWYTPEVDDVNKILSDFGFSELSENGQFLNGFGAKFNVGKGLILGGMGAFYERELINSHPFIDTANNTTVLTKRKLSYSVAFGGVTVEQRIGLSNKVISSLGAMIGGGSTSIDVTQNDPDYDWNKIAAQFENPYNNSINLTRNYFVLQPKAELFFRINSWLGIRGEAGYILGYSFQDGWIVDDDGESYEIKNSPATKFDGMTFSVGPWFGF